MQKRKRAQKKKQYCDEDKRFASITIADLSDVSQMIEVIQ